jgi:RNA polymerase sigma-70 factor (ECF subfamily)
MARESNNFREPASTFWRNQLAIGPVVKNPPDPDTEELVRRARDGDHSAVARLFDRFRERLRRMVAVRMDDRLLSRVDPSDIVQEALVDALRELPEYLRERPVAFYPWLRHIAWKRLVALHRRHIRSRQRSVARERSPVDFKDGSSVHLAAHLASNELAPGARLVRKEMHDRVRKAVEQLEPDFREILVLRHLEQLSVAEVAELLDIAAGTVKSRHFRALERLRSMLEELD